MNEEQDFALLEQWRAGDDGAGNRLVRRHFGPVFRFFDSKVSKGADDLTQRTFLACVESRDRFRGDCSFRGYVLSIARNQLLMHFRKKGREARVIEFTHASVQDLDPSPSRVIANEEQQRLLLLALRRIPIDFQIAVELYYWEEMSIADIAAVLDVAPGTVKSRLGRAREKLAAAMRELSTDAALVQSSIDDLEGWARSLRQASLDRRPDEGE